jgi:SAM-dependent methyltransferase
MARAPAPACAAGLLGDTPARDYAHKLQRFHGFAAPELEQIAAALGLRPGMRVLDAGCGTGEMLARFARYLGPEGRVAGIDLAGAHARAARAAAPAHCCVAQADLTQPPFAPGSFDLVWSLNTLNHLHDPDAGVRALAALLTAGGRLVLAQSSLLPDMFFAWDARLERVTTEAVHRYYRERYRVSERDLTAVRALLGLLRRASLGAVSVKSWLIERVAPLRAEDEAYLLESQFRGTWGERLRPYLSAEDFSELSRLCDPTDGAYALRRPDFHFLQTLTVAVALKIRGRGVLQCTSQKQ